MIVALFSYHVSFQVCQHKVAERTFVLRPCLSGCRLSWVVSWSLCRATHSLPPLRHWCTVGVLAGTHQCATESRLTLWQSANPLCVLVGVVTSCVLCTRVRGRVSRSCATENAHILARLEGLFKLSVVTILRHSYRSLKHPAGFGCSVQLVILFEMLLLVVGGVDANLFLSR